MNPAGGMVAHAMHSDIAAISVTASLEALGNSAILGILLTSLTVWVSAVTANLSAKESTDVRLSPADLIANSANVLFICFGMTGMLLLVNNNVARAFAIAATIALVRFKIKVDSKLMSMSMFYAVLIGMACGVGHSFIGYVLVMFFGLLQFAVIGAVKVAVSRDRSRAVKTPYADSLATVK